MSKTQQLTWKISKPGKIVFTEIKIKSMYCV